MAHRHGGVVFTVTLLLACATPVSAWPPCGSLPQPANSTVPARLVACPLGDVEYRVVLRDAGNFPLANDVVELDFSTCAGATFCPVQADGVTWDPTTRVASMTSDADGVAAFHLKMGGVCPGGTIQVRTCKMVLNPTGVLGASPDQDCDLLVNGADVTIVRGLLGTSSPQADFDGDGTISPADLAFVTEQHPAHACDGIVPARPASWGALKQIYR